MRPIKALNISTLLSRCGICKNSRTIAEESSGSKRSAFEIFQFLLLMVFQGCNLYRFLRSKRQDIVCSKSTYHRLLSNEHYNWHRFITLLAADVLKQCLGFMGIIRAKTARRAMRLNCESRRLYLSNYLIIRLCCHFPSILKPYTSTVFSLYIWVVSEPESGQQDHG